MVTQRVFELAFELCLVDCVAEIFLELFDRHVDQGLVGVCGESPPDVSAEILVVYSATPNVPASTAAAKGQDTVDSVS